MTSTVTTTTIDVMNGTLYFGALGVIIAVALFLLLVNREILTTSTHPLASVLRRVLNIAIFPLLLTFVLVLFASLLQFLK